jgi:DNA-binding GntR family transcriptional regulator
MKRDAGNERSMREVAYQHIQRKIATRTFRAGDPVSELPVAKELGISRTPTREAIRQLVAEGILEEVAGRGVLVVKLDVRDIEEIYEVREALEVQAVARMARQVVGAVELKNLRKVADEMLNLTQALQKSGRDRLDAKEMTRFEAADIGFHTYLLQIAGNRRSMKIVAAMRTLIRIVAMRRVGHGLEELRRIHQDHVDIIAALEAGDPARAAAVASGHVRASQQARLEQFIQRERESSLPQDIGAFIQQIQADLG